MFIIDRNEKGKYELIPRKAEDVISRLEPGVYNIEVKNSWNDVRIVLTENHRYHNTKMIEVGVFKEAIDHIDFFLSDEARTIREEMGMMHKLSLIFNGGPGTGKTFLAGQLMEKLVKDKNAICLVSKGMIQAVSIHDIIDSIRLEDPDRMIGILLDEYEKQKGGELDMLSFLDGTNSRNNMVLIATVNSTNTLPETIVDRIGRIEKVYNFDENNKEVLIAMVDSIIPEKYKGLINKEEIINEISYFKAKPTIDFISVLVRNNLYEILTNKKAPKLKQKRVHSKSTTVTGFKPQNNKESINSKNALEKTKERIINDADIK